MIKIGDKVRYLDAVGGGSVTGFKGKDVVMVLEDDGFETPVLIRQCVVLQPEEPSAQKGSQRQSTEVKTSVAIAAKTKANPEPTPSTLVGKRPPLRLSEEGVKLFLAFLPEEGTPFNDARMESYLINDSNYDLLFNLAVANGKALTTLRSGQLEPNTKEYLETFSREEIPDREHVIIQVLAYKKGAFYPVQKPISCELRLEQVKFYKIHCFKENDYFEDDALLFPIP
jgi:hypothetical protein